MVTKHASLLKKLPSWLYKPLAQKWISYDYPRHIYVETTATCNLSCSYCPREKVRYDMDFELFKDIIREASRYGRRSFSLHLFGEPLLYPKILEAISFIKFCNRRHTILLTTNGTKLNEFVDDIKEVDQILWSWRRESQFTPETKRKLLRWGRFKVRFITEVTPKEAYKEWETWPNKEVRSLHNYGGEVKLSQFGAEEKELKRYPCYHLWLSPAVAWNGKILICCSDPHQKEVLGQFPQMTVAEAWSGTKIKEIRRSHLEGKFSGICKDCNIWASYPSVF